MASNRIFLEVKFESADAEKDITRLNQNIKNIGGASENATKVAAKGMTGFKLAVEQTSSAITGMAQAMAGLGLAQSIHLMASMADEIARVRRSFEGVAGGAEAFKEIQRVARIAGYDMALFVKTANDLKNAGVGMEKLPGLMMAFANATAAAGNTQEELADVVKEVSKEMATGTVSARSLVRLSQAGFKPMADIMKQLNLTAAQARESIARIPVDQIVAAVERIGASHPGAAATESMKQMSLQANKLKTDLADLGDVIGKAFGPQLLTLVMAVDSVLKKLIELTKWLGEMPKGMKDLLTFLAMAAAAFATLGLAAKSVVFVWEGVALAFGPLQKAFTWLVKILPLASMHAELFALKLGVVEEAAAIGAVAGWGARLIPIIGTISLIVSGLVLVYQWWKKVNAERDKKPDDVPIKPGYDGPFTPVPDAEEMQRLMDQALNLLAEANKKAKTINLESIAALTYAYEEHYRGLAKNEAAVAVARKAYIIDVQTELLKRQEEVRRNTLKFYEEAAVMERKIAVARAQLIPDDTVAGQRSQLQYEQQAYADEVRIRRDAAIAEQQRVTDLQKTAIEESALSEMEKRKQMAGWDASQLVVKTQLEKKANDDIQLNRLQTAMRTNQLIIDHEQRLRDEAAQDRVSRIQQNYSLTQARINLGRPERLSERMEVIDQTYQAELSHIEDVRKANEDALTANYEAYKKLHPTGAGLLEEYNKFLREYTRLNYQADTDIQMARLEAWKAGDEAILNEQKRVYEGLKTEVDKVFDALFDKSKSIWSSIASAFKTAVMGAIKEIVTSRIAGALMSMLGYGQVSYRGPIWNQIPYFSGAGTPPSGEAVRSAPRFPVVFPPAMLPAPGTAPNSADGYDPHGADRMVAKTLDSIYSDAVYEQRGGGTSGGANRSADQMINDAQAVTTAASTMGMPVASGINGGTIYAQLPPMARQQKAAGMRGSMAEQMANFKASMNIGKPVALPGGRTIPWSQASASARLGSVLKSPAVAALAASIGLPVMMSGLKRGGVLGDVMSVGGGALAGAGFASMLGGNPIAGAMIGGGIGLIGAGWRRGGAAGIGMDVLGGISAGAGIGFTIGSAFGPLGMAAGTVIGAAAGAVVGLGIGITRLFVKTKDENLRAALRRAYGIDITNFNIRKQILDIIDQKYSGNIQIGIYSQDVQELVRLYSLTQGTQAAGMPRPMYGASFAQSGGSLALQPVYSNGQLVANPYTGMTTTQFAQTRTAASNGVYIQLNPQVATDLLTGKVVNVLNQNPGTVATANSAATRSGTERVTQRGLLMEPLTVMR